MPNIDKHVAGDFCWIELATTDQAAAKKFYESLFGWSIYDSPMGPNEFYTMFSLEGRNTGAAYTMRKDQVAQGIPPFWMLYIATESADASAAKAAQLGGTVLMPALDVMDAGRMAVIQDPAGAVFSVWQSNKHQGTQITGVDGTLCWADLSTSDQQRAGSFYADLFGWEIMKEEEEPKHNYWHIKNGESFIGGIPPASHRNPKIPPHWEIYLQVSDCDATAAKAKQLGAKLYLPPTDFENVGRISVIADPQGAVFAIFKAARK
ncbi:MAG TPA: VOC family protein [Terriglobia bacterium]|nr:VOC family protein [Terriglobia bacterium]